MTRTADDRRAAFRKGRAAELFAAFWLMLKGYRVLDRRVRSPGAEIDIIARRGRTLIFVEVKARAGRTDAEIALTAGQRRRIVAAAEKWRLGHARHTDCAVRYDMILISHDGPPRHVRGAFDADF